MPSHGPELHPISTVQTPNRSTTVPAPKGLQSKFLNRGMQGDGEVKGNGDKTLITVTDGIAFLLRTIRVLKCLVELRHSSPGQYFVFLMKKKSNKKSHRIHVMFTENILQETHVRLF